MAIDPSTFEVAGEGTAEEIAAILNADPNFSANNLQARVVGDRLAIQTQGEGVAESFQITGGSAATPLGLKADTYTGQDLAVDVAPERAVLGTGQRQLDLRAARRRDHRHDAGARDRRP